MIKKLEVGKYYRYDNTQYKMDEPGHGSNYAPSCVFKVIKVESFDDRYEFRYIEVGKNYSRSWGSSKEFAHKYFKELSEEEAVFEMIQ